MPGWRGRQKVIMHGSTVDEEHALIEERRAGLHRMRSHEDAELDRKLSRGYPPAPKRPRVVVEGPTGTRLEVSDLQAPNWTRKGWRIVDRIVSEKVPELPEGAASWSIEEVQAWIDDCLDSAEQHRREQAAHKARLLERFG